MTSRFSMLYLGHIERIVRTQALSALAVRRELGGGPPGEPRSPAGTRRARESATPRELARPLAATEIAPAGTPSQGPTVRAPRRGRDGRSDQRERGLREGGGGGRSGHVYHRAQWRRQVHRVQGAHGSPPLVGGRDPHEGAAS